VIVHFAKYNYNDDVKEDEMGGTSGTNGEKWKAYRLLVGNRKRTLGRSRRKLADNIKTQMYSIIVLYSHYLMKENNILLYS
jgi:hypothetical protein